MAQRTKAQLTEDIAIYIKDNGGSNPTKTKGAELKILEQNIVDSLLAYDEEASVVEGNLESSTVSNKFISPRRWWSAFSRSLELAWTWPEKQLYSKGITLGNNTLPTANGDLWFNAGANAFQGRIASANYNLLTSLNGKVGRVLFVSKDGNDSTAIVGSQSFSYFTIQAAVTASTSGDTIVIYNGTYTENIALGRNIPNRTFIFINATLNGTISNTTFNGCNYGRIIGIGNAVITGAISITGNGTAFESIENMTLNVLSAFSNFYKNCNFTIAGEGYMYGTYENCTFTSVGGLITTYGASAGFKLFNCRITCVDFTTGVGGIDGGAGGQYVIQNCRINCTNFFSTRITSVVLQITDSTIKASGTSWFLSGEGSVQFKVQIANSVLQTACTALDQNNLNASSIISAISNKATSGTYSVMPTVISSLNLI